MYCHYLVPLLSIFISTLSSAFIINLFLPYQYQFFLKEMICFERLTIFVENKNEIAVPKQVNQWKPISVLFESHHQF